MAAEITGESLSGGVAMILLETMNLGNMGAELPISHPRRTSGLRAALLPGGRTIIKAAKTRVKPIKKTID
jgi:hypothetical protein